MKHYFEVEDFTPVELMISPEMIERIDRVLTSHALLSKLNRDSFAEKCLVYVVSQLEAEPTDDLWPGSSTLSQND